MTIYLLFGLVMLTGFLFNLFNEFEDESVRNNFSGRLEWLNQHGSWKRKWKMRGNSTIEFIPSYVKVLWFQFPRKWWYFGVYPENVERFLYSSTIFVFLTDPEHALQFLKHRMIEASLLVAVFYFSYAGAYFYLIPVSWFVGVKLFSFVKERFLKAIH